MLALAAMLIGKRATAEPTPSLLILPQVIHEADRPDGPDIFGTVALPISAQPISTRWSKVMKAPLNQPSLARLVAKAEALPPIEQAAHVQSAVNFAVRRKGLAYDCSDDGYWASTEETLARGIGDCFDLAIAKMEALRLLGIPARDLYLTTGYFGRRNKSAKGRQSAALLVRVDERFWLMSEYVDWIVEAGDSLDGSVHFVPIITYGVGVSWIHGQRLTTALREN